MNSLALRIYTVITAAIVMVAIMVTINANQTARLWQQQASAQTRLVQQALAQQGAARPRPGTAAAVVAAPQQVSATAPVTRAS